MAGLSGLSIGVRPSISLTGGGAYDTCDKSLGATSQLKGQLLALDVLSGSNTVSVVPGVVIDGQIDAAGVHPKVGFDLDIRVAEGAFLPLLTSLAPRTYSAGVQVFNDKARIYTGVDFRLPITFSGALSIGPTIGYTQPYSAAPGAIDVGVGVKGSLDLMLGLLGY